MRRSVVTILKNLEFGPELLADLISNIPKEKLKSRPQDGSWSIHEWACHLVVAQDIIQERLEKFSELDQVHIKVYSPDLNSPQEELLDMDLDRALNFFSRKREWLLRFSSDKSSEFWLKPGTHDDYDPYNPHILLRHALLADHFHMFHIEDLWLKK